MEAIDRKFILLAVNPCHENDVHTNEDSFLFLARDKFAPAALEGYIKAMRDSEEVGDAQVGSAELLLERVKAWQVEHGLRIPDVDEGCEMDVCLKPNKSQIPRRIRMDLWTPGEKAIHEAIQMVEKMGADALLTEAVIFLGKAKEKVADFIEAN